jgi:hypothetical protein
MLSVQTKRLSYARICTYARNAGSSALYLPLVQLLRGEGKLLQARALAGDVMTWRHLRPVLKTLSARHVEWLVGEAAAI